MINKVLRTVKDSLEFKIAHLFHTDKKKFLEYFKAFEVYYITLAFSLFTVAYYLIIPFLTLYTKNVTDINYIDKILPLFFVLINLLSAGRYTSEAMVHIAGHFKSTKNSAMIETGINIVSSIVLIRFFGIYGVLLGTVVSSLYRANYLILYVNKHIIERSPLPTYRCWGVNFIIFILFALMHRILVFQFDSYWEIFVACLPILLIVILIYFSVVSLLEMQSFKLVYRIGKKALKKLLQK